MLIRSRHTHRRGGAALVELVAAAPLIVLLVFGMMEAGRMCTVSIVLANAAREGCRVAVSRGKTSTDVSARVKSTLSAAGISSSAVTMTLTPSTIETTTLNTQISLKLSVPFTSVYWLKSPFFYKSTTLSSTTVMLSQRP